MGLFDFFKTNSNNVKNITFKLENRGSGVGKVSDEIWSSWKSLEGGTLTEDAEKIQLKNKNGEIFTFSKIEELLASKMYNRFLSHELTIFEIYEESDFLLYRFKNEDRKNEFVISGIMGMAICSSINFKID